MIDLTPRALDTVRKILREHVPGCTVLAFGSRVRWTAKDYSDLDLAVRCAERLSLTQLGALREALEASDLPIRVDVVDWHAVSPEFRRVIEGAREVIVEGDKESQDTLIPLGKGTEWVEVTVADIAARSPNALATGPFGSTISSKYFQSFGVPVIRGSNLSDAIDKRLLENGFVFLDPEKASEFSRSVARKGDLVFTCWGTIGQVGLIDDRAQYDEYIISNKQMKLTPDPDRASSLFLYYVFSSSPVVDAIKNQAIGSSVPGFNLGQLKSIRLHLPPLNEQHAIAHILGTLDDKIELNRRMNETLEAMARALFKSWFVDFDPVRAKAEGRAPSGMDAETARLFPSEFVESELGLIPKGWRVCPLGDVIELKRGYDLPAVNRKPGSVPIISSSGPSGWHQVAMANGPGIVTGRYGTIGQVFWVRDSFWPLNTTLYVKDCKGNELEYCYRVLCGINFDKFSDKAAVPGINRNHLHQELVTVAPADLQRCFSSIASSWRTLAVERKVESESVITIRDALLPKLLSGKLSVAHAERIAEAAT